MKLSRLAAIAASVSLLSSAALAQRPSVDPSVISGRWGTFGIPLLELDCDAQGAVTGTVHFRFGSPVSAPIAAGRFDPVERTLKLEGRVDAETTYRIEASLDGDQLQVSYDVGDRRGGQVMTKLVPEGPDGR